MRLLRKIIDLLPDRAAEWLGGFIIDRAFAHETELRKIAADNERKAG